MLTNRRRKLLAYLKSTTWTATTRSSPSSTFASERRLRALLFTERPSLGWDVRLHPPKPQPAGHSRPAQRTKQKHHMKQKHSVTIDELGITIGAWAPSPRLANGAVTIGKGETTLFVSATAAEDLRLRPGLLPPDRRLPREVRGELAGRFPARLLPSRRQDLSDKEILTLAPLRPSSPSALPRRLPQ
jgi:hypothetical protein